MNIGHFTKTKEGNFTGSITAIGAVFPKVTITAIEARGTNPNFRITTQGADLGGAWNKTSSKGKAYLSVSFKSPFLAAPVYAALLETSEADKFDLVWNEPKTKSED